MSDAQNDLPRTLQPPKIGIPASFAPGWMSEPLTTTHAKTPIQSSSQSSAPTYGGGIPIFYSDDSFRIKFKKKTWLHAPFDPKTGQCCHCGKVINTRNCTVRKAHLLNPRICRYLASSEANSNPDSCVVAALSALAAASTPQRGYPASSVSTLATKIVQPLSGQYPPSSPTTPSNLSENLGHLPSSSAIPSNLGPQPSSSAILTSGLIQLRPLLSSASAMTSNQRMGRSLSFNGYSDPHIGSHSASGSIAVQECEISSPREARQCQGPSQTLLDESKGIHISRAMPFMDVPFQIDQTRAIIDTCMTDSTRASIIPTMHLGDIPKVTYRGITAADNGLVHFSALRPPEGFHETAEDMIATARNGGSKILKKRPASGMSFTTDVNFLRHDAEKRYFASSEAASNPDKLVVAALSAMVTSEPPASQIIVPPPSIVYNVSHLAQMGPLPPFSATMPMPSNPPQRSLTPSSAVASNYQTESSLSLNGCSDLLLRNSVTEGFNETQDMMTRGVECSRLNKRPASGMFSANSDLTQYEIAEKRCKILEATCSALQNDNNHLQAKMKILQKRIIATSEYINYMATTISLNCHQAVTLRKTQLAYETSLEALPPACAWTPEWCSRMRNMDLASFLNYHHSYVKSIWRLLGNDPEDMGTCELLCRHNMVAYSSLLGREFKELTEKKWTMGRFMLEHKQDMMLYKASRNLVTGQVTEPGEDWWRTFVSSLKSCIPPSIISVVKRDLLIFEEDMKLINVERQAIKARLSRGIYPQTSFQGLGFLETDSYLQELQELIKKEGRIKARAQSAAMSACGLDAFTYGYLRSYPYVFDLHQVLKRL